LVTIKTVQSLTTWKDWWAQMSEIKLLALDLDGTLFTKDKQVTAENRAALKAAEAKGVHVVITTGRPLPAITLTFVDVESIDDIPENIVYNKVVTVCEEAFLDAQIQKIPDHLYQAFEVFKSREIILEVMPKGVHKAVGLRLLTDYLALDKSQVMAMGDEENDLTMLEWAGLGVAMANAVPKVKAVAKAVTTKTNEESGVAEAIHKYILEK